ncbi:alpha/beta-hydrolase [Ramaria rubella]|nr:alpha/beta-hydrolase [Ramaria rubella]
MSTQTEQWPTFFDPNTCVRKGHCPVTKNRGGSEVIESHKLYFEQHGTGPEQIIFLMGLNTASFWWFEQVKHFAGTEKYSALVFDGRGVGNSGMSRGLYTTAGMAEDTITLLDYVGWKKDIHVVGLSLGGMVAQGTIIQAIPYHLSVKMISELATRITDRIVSLTLCVTMAGGFSWNTLPPVSSVFLARTRVHLFFDTGHQWKGISCLLRGTVAGDMNVGVQHFVDMCFPTQWLDSPNLDDPDKRTNRELQAEMFRHRLEITRPQTLGASLSQTVAAITHRVTADRHRLIASSIPKILILTGDDDAIVHPGNSIDLAERMPEAELVCWESTGHGVHAQWPGRFNDLLERTFKEGRERFEARNK